MRAYSTLLSMILAALCGFASNARAIEADEIGGAFAAADVYPSQRAAVTRLASQVVGTLREGPDRLEDGATVRIYGTGNADSSLVDLLALRLQQAFPTIKLERGAKPDALGLAVELDASNKNAIAATIRGGKRVGAQVFVASYVDKPWVDDWGVFRNANTSKRLLLAVSSSPGATEAEAITSAQKDAVDQLAPLMTETIRANAARFRGEKIPVSQAWIRERLLSSIKRNNDNILVADSFVQRFSRPYGEVYCASLLVDASQKTINKLAEGYNEYARAMVRQETSTQRTTFGATAGILVVVVLLYAFLNTVTKGYFLWRLRAVALLMAIGGLLVVFAATS